MWENDVFLTDLHNRTIQSHQNKCILYLSAVALALAGTTGATKDTGMADQGILAAMFSNHLEA